MTNVLVTGGNGQLGKCIRDVEKTSSDLKIHYTDFNDLDITNFDQVDKFFNDNFFDYCINCAAYTAVDKAETDKDKAEQINCIGARNLALAANKNSTTLIHISTDFVFDGNQPYPYSEQDSPNPLGVYGLTKLNGEREVSTNCKKHFIIRTSWLYSEHGNNFMKTMIKLSADKSHLNIVADQVGSPTYATDLAMAILTMINSESSSYGIYHYSNQGVASWYDFALAIFEERDIVINVSAIPSESYPTPAKRPKYSVLNTNKIKNELQIEIPHWKHSLKRAIANAHE